MADETEIPSRPVARIVPGQAARQRVVPLEWPVEFDGKVYSSITVRRCTGTEISDYTIAVASGENAKPPMVDCPTEVYDALDDDDLYEVDKAVKDFLPRRFLAGADEPKPEASGNTSIKSDTPSAEAAPK